MQPTDPRFLDKLYELPIVPEGWPDVLHELARSANAVGACIAADQGTETAIARPVSPDLTDAIDDFITNGWYRRDIRGHRAWPAFKRGRQVLVEHEVSTEDERKFSAYHNEWLRPWDLPWWGAVGIPVGDTYCGLVLLRSERAGPLTQQEMRPYLALRPHLGRVLELTKLLANQRAEAIVDALQLVGHPAFLLGGNGRVMRINAHAEQLVPNLFSLAGGRLAIAGGRGEAGLQRLVAAIQSPLFPRNTSELAPAIIRRQGLQPVVLRVLPLRGALSEVLQGARAILIAADLARTARPDPGLLRALYALTPAETNLALALAETLDLALAAARLGITHGTARNHLKAIFAKTETRRQSELIAILHNLGSAQAPA